MSLAILSEPIPLTTDAHGVVRVGGTRVTLDVVIGAYNRGAGAEDILRKFPTLSLADVYATISYYLRHREEIDAYLETRRIEASQVQEQVEARFGSGPSRSELLARQRE